MLTTYRRSEGSGSWDEKDLLDHKGKKLATYHRLEALASGQFIAGKDKVNGMLDSKGKVIVPLKYRYLEKAGDGLLWAEDGSGRRFFVSETGEEYRIRN